MLIGPDVVSTMPDKTLRALADHGRVAPTIDSGADEAQQVLEEFTNTRVDLDVITIALQREGVASFCDSYHQLLDCIAEEAESLGSPIDAR